MEYIYIYIHRFDCSAASNNDLGSNGLDVLTGNYPSLWKKTKTTTSDLTLQWMRAKLCTALRQLEKSTKRNWPIRSKKNRQDGRRTGFKYDIHWNYREFFFKPRHVLIGPINNELIFWIMWTFLSASQCLSREHAKKFLTFFIQTLPTNYTTVHVGIKSI
jgi:hypothetical protein